MNDLAPNILLITADDMDIATPGAFGGSAVTTPAIDALCREGMSFHRAHVAAAVCQPSRSAMVTGRWPHRNGAEGFEPIDDNVPLITDVLRIEGYATAILGKVEHLQPIARFQWDQVLTMHELGMGRSAARYGEASSSFMGESAAAGRPWFIMANAHDPHRPFHGSDEENLVFTEAEQATVPAPSRTFSPEEAELVPGFLPDIAEVRLEYAEYLSSSRRCDDVVRALLAALDDSGQSHNTVVIFVSDNGMAFPFAKANCYLRSTATPLVIRWPGRVRAGSVEAQAFVSLLDLFPTICEIAGVESPGDVDGRSLLPLLDGEDRESRDEVFTVFHETSLGQRLEMRSVQDAEFGYIWNAWSDSVERYSAENMAGRSWPAMLAAAADDQQIAERTQHYLFRSPEELYDLLRDPDCLVNLADNAAFERVLNTKRSRLAQWFSETNDPLSARFEDLMSRTRPLGAD